MQVGIRNPQQARQEIQALLGDITQLKTGIGRVNNNYQSAQRDVRDAGSELRWTSSPLSQAERDNANTNVSNAGWELDRYMRNSERDLRSADSDINFARNDSRQVTQGMTEAKADIKKIKQLIADQPDALLSLDKAASALDGAFDSHRSAESDADWARDKNGSAEREINSGSWNVSNIRNDRPGLDVSSDARNLRFKIDQANWSIRDAEGFLTGAYRKEDRASSGLDSVDQALRDALAKIQG